MTLLVLNHTDFGFFLYTDSRISTLGDDKPRKITDTFTKSFVVPYLFTVGEPDLERCEKYSGDIGFGFSGNTLAATAIAMMSGNILRNMHSNNRDAAPTFETILDIVLRATGLFHEETILNPRPYQAFVFGFCPSTGLGKVALLTLKDDSGVKKYQTETIDLPIGGVTAIGSGSRYFWEIMIRDKDKGRRLCDVVYDAVSNNVDLGTGGAVQMISITENGGSYHAIMQPADEGGAKMYVSGLCSVDLGIVDGFHMGRVLTGVGLDVIKRNHDRLQKK